MAMDSNLKHGKVFNKKPVAFDCYFKSEVDIDKP